LLQERCVLGKVMRAASYPSRVISPNLDRTEMGVAARHAVLSMQNVTGNIWMLDNVDK
jgi:hypothetical protein